MRKNIFNQTFARSWSLILLSYWCCGLLNNILFFPFLPRCQSMLLRDSYYVRWESKLCYAKPFNKKKYKRFYVGDKFTKRWKIIQACSKMFLMKRANACSIYLVALCFSLRCWSYFWVHICWHKTIIIDLLFILYLEMSPVVF